MSVMMTWTMRALAALLAVSAAPAAAEPEILTVHHFLSPKSKTHTDMLEPWARAVEAGAGGRLKVEIFPAMAMGGKPPELYRQARDGFADAVWTLIGYTPGVFPRSEVFELPTVHQGSALATNRAIYAHFDLIADDFKDVKPLLIHVHAGNALHLRADGVARLEDVGGLKLRTPSRTGAWMIEAWGADPVGMPAPALPLALSKGGVDGALVPFEIMGPLKLEELTRLSLEGPGGARFGTSVFMFAMNKARYEALSAEARAAIDAASGARFGEAMGRVWDAAEVGGRTLQTDSGGRVAELAPEVWAAFEAKGARVVERWIEESAAQGFDGARLVSTVRAAIESQSGG